MTRLVLGVVVLLFAGCGDGWSSAPPLDALPPVECVGIPAATCQTIVADARRNAEPGTVPIRIRAVCATPPCTIQQGDVNVEVRYSNGRADQYSMGWAGPGAGQPPVPVVPPVEPTCQGVPIETCRDMAISAVTGVTGGPAVTAILVRCSATCTSLQGDGETILTFADGTTTTATWGYSNSEP
jgi:hypothetical protein